VSVQDTDTILGTVYANVAKVEDAARRSRLGGEVQGIEGEAVVTYREPSITKEMRYPRLSQRVKNMTNSLHFWNSSAVNS